MYTIQQQSEVLSEKPGKYKKSHFMRQRSLRKFRINKTLPNSRINMTPPTIMQKTSITMTQLFYAVISTRIK